MGAKRLLHTVAAGAVLLAASGCGGGDSDGSSSAGRDPTTTAVGPAPGAPGGGPRQPVDGFGTVGYRVSTTPAAARCALLADSALARARGLMNRTDLAGFDGMLFVFDSDTTGSFWMKDTPLPLSIAWFDSEGRFVSSADMEPCLNRGSDCPSYSARGTYRYALEVPQGGLGALGIGPGAVLTLGDPCT